MRHHTEAGTLTADSARTLSPAHELMSVHVTRKPSPWTDMVAAVTGAASGIGAATARHLLELGARVVAIDVRDDLDSLWQDMIILRRLWDQ